MNLEIKVENSIPFPESESGSSACLDDFELIRCIGHGAYGQVWLCQKKDVLVLYAIKILSKSQLSKSTTLIRSLRERRLMELVNSPFIVKLRYSFQDESYLYFVMDYYSGGDFFSLIERQPYYRMSEENAKQYLAEVVLALEYLHSMGVVYRDLKMENILLTNDGHIILTDLGMSRTLQSGQRSMSYVGTPEYMSPEIISRKGHGVETDYWSLGVLAYQILVGVLPFEGNTLDKVFARILRQPLIFPPFLSQDARNLIGSLLCRDVSTRLGHHGIHELKSHSFFCQTDWSQIQSRCIPLPLTTAYAQYSSLKGTEMIKRGMDHSAFDRFSHYVDGTDRYHQKHLIRKVLQGWMKYHLEDEILMRMDDAICGSAPSRGIWNQANANPMAYASCGYFQYTNKGELQGHIENERVCFSNVASCFCQMSVFLEDRTILFEGDSITCQWKAWGRNDVDDFVCIHGSITVHFGIDNCMKQLSISTVVSPALLFGSLTKQMEGYPQNESCMPANVENREMLVCILHTIENSSYRMYYELEQCSIIQSLQSTAITVYSHRYCMKVTKNLAGFIHSLFESLRNRNVAIEKNDNLSRVNHNGTSFIISGVHVMELFGIPPTNDVAYLYGWMSIQDNKLEGCVYLEGVMDDTLSTDLLASFHTNGMNDIMNDIMNNIVNEMNISGIEKACWLGICNALHDQDQHMLVVSIRQLAKQWYLTMATVSIHHIYGFVSQKMNFCDPSECFAINASPYMKLRRGLFVLLISASIQEYLAREVVRSI